MAVFLAALTPVSAALFWAILVPLLLFVGTAIMVWAEPDRKKAEFQPTLPLGNCFARTAQRCFIDLKSSD